MLIKCKELQHKAPVLALPPLLSATADKGVRAQSSNYNSALLHYSLPTRLIQQEIIDTRPFDPSTTHLGHKLRASANSGQALRGHKFSPLRPKSIHSTNLIYIKLTTLPSREKADLEAFFPVFEKYFMPRNTFSLRLEPAKSGLHTVFQRLKYTANPQPWVYKFIG